MKKIFMLFQPLRITRRLQLCLHCHMTVNQSHWVPLSPTCTHSFFVFHRSIQNRDSDCYNYTKWSDTAQNVCSTYFLFFTFTPGVPQKGPLHLNHMGTQPAMEHQGNNLSTLHPIKQWKPGCPTWRLCFFFFGSVSDSSSPFWVTRCFSFFLFSSFISLLCIFFFAILRKNGM